MTCFTASTLRSACVALAGLVLAQMPAAGQAPKVVEPAEAKNMRLMGFNDLQARSAYQPTIHKQGDRYIAYVGHHGGSYDGKPANPIKGVPEFNGSRSWTSPTRCNRNIWCTFPAPRVAPRPAARR